MISEKDAQAAMVNVCKKVLEGLSIRAKIQVSHVNIRIHMENMIAKPVFRVYEKSDFIQQIELNELINLAGGKGLGFIVGIHVRNTIKSIFTELCKRLNEDDPSEVFLLLFGKEDKEEKKLEPFFAFYNKGQKIDVISVAELVGGNINT